MHNTLKQKLIQQILCSKTDNLNLTKKKKRFSFGGKLLQVLFLTKFTKFDIAEYVKVSKKQRTNISEKKVKDVLQYSFLGYCFNFKKDKTGLNCSFSLRNVLDGFPIEMIFPLYSPAINCISFQEKIFQKKATRAKFYFLRKKPLPDSLMEFSYVVRKKEELKIIRSKTIRKLRN
jgi:ribosomal protein L19